MKVLSLSSEIFPLVKTGGLADVAGALPGALAPEGVEVVSLVPGYPAVMNALESPEEVATYDNLPGGPGRLLRGRAKGLDLLVLDAPNQFTRSGNPYIGPDGRDWPDNAFRFAALAMAGARVGLDGAGEWQPDVVHAHDWQTALAPAYMTYAGGRRPGTVVTIHNLAFQGQYPPDILGRIGLPPQAYSIDGVEYYGMVGYLKAGLALADRITTVSPTYAAEIRTVEGGMGLDGLLRTRSHVLHGILNGIDEEVWNPAADPHLAAGFDAARLDDRVANKIAVQARFGLDQDPGRLLLGVVSRLSWQKGLDLLLESLGAVLRSGAQLVILGSGEPGIEWGFQAAAGRDPGSIGCRIGYDEGMAHLIQGGVDAILVPSRFEPCGLTQLCALRYGAVPIVARVGGLADTVVDANEMAIAAGVGTGIMFSPPSRDMLETAIWRAANLWRDREAWRRLMLDGMRTDVSWRRPAAHYARLYRDLCAARNPH